MSKFIIKGPCKLKGTVEVSGAKNAALKMMAATVLTKEKCILNNIPRIADIETMKQILESIGAKVTWIGKHRLEIDPAKINSYKPDSKLMVKMRASVVLTGPLLGRFGKAEIAEPGGCVIGARPTYEHWDALSKFNVKVTKKNNSTLLETNGLTGTKIMTIGLSVTATENAIMAAVMAKGLTQIRVAACEPEVQDLVRMLRKMGAKIKGEATHFIEIVGVKKLNGVEYNVLPDRIEAMTFAIAGIVTNSNIIIKKIIPNHLDIVFDRFNKAGVNYSLVNIKGEYCDLKIAPSKKLHPIKIDSRPYPGYPTDLQAQTGVLMTQLPKTSKIFETIFEGRLKYLDELAKMGVKVKIVDSHTAEITGPCKLKGTKITSFDLRAGATLVIAGLIASGTTEISNIGTIDRGYEDIEGKLQKLGADIARVR
jgi:UDP-N-acetylglucosamine 1-carboxyvinyltransferase